MTKLSSRGQVVIPKAMRQSLGLVDGSGLLVFKLGDSIILKNPGPLPAAEVEDGIRRLRSKIKRLGITRRDVQAEVFKVRRKRGRS